MKDIIFKTLMLKGEAGSTIVSMERTGHSGTTDTYTITFDDGSTTDIQIENLSSVESIELTSQTDTEDTYTATLADGSTQSFSVLNHNADIEAISEELAAGLASITSDLNAQSVLLNARMDTFTSLPSGSTSGDAELMDIRIGEYGESFGSAGSAVRGQNSEIKKILGIIFDYGYIKTNGQISYGGTDRLYSRMIPCPPNASVTYVGENNHANVLGIAFYNKYRTLISGDGNHGSLGDVTTVVSPNGTCFLRLSTKVAIKQQSYVKFNHQLRGVLDFLQIQIDAKDSFAYVDGNTGNDNEDAGSPQMPFKTIQGAISYGFRNLRIAAGTYNETVNVDGGSIRMAADWASFVSGSVTDRPKVIIDGESTIETALTIQNCSEVVLEDIIVQNCTSNGALINKCQDIKLQNCDFLNNGNNGIVINYSNGVIRDCEANYNGNDGFNMNYFGDTQFYNCVGHHNADDGISHHQGCTGCINGGEWHNNGKGGVASPAHGAQVDLLNFYSHHNAYGVYANADSDTVARTFRIWNCVLTDNHANEHSGSGSGYGLTSKRNTCYMYNCKIANNDHGTTAPSGGSIIVLD